MDSRILYLDTLTEPIVRLRIVFVYIIVTMDKECSKTSFAFAIRRFITCLIVHGLHITLPAVTHITAVYHLFIRPSTSASSTTLRLKETIITIWNKTCHTSRCLVNIQHFVTNAFLRSYFFTITLFNEL